MKMKNVQHWNNTMEQIVLDFRTNLILVIVTQQNM